MATAPGLHRMTRPLPSRASPECAAEKSRREGNSRGRAAANRQEKTPERRGRRGSCKVVPRHAQHQICAPRAGFEPATCRLTVECSTAELPGIIALRGVGGVIQTLCRFAKRFLKIFAKILKALKNNRFEMKIVAMPRCGKNADHKASHRIRKTRWPISKSRRVKSRSQTESFETPEVASSTDRPGSGLHRWRLLGFLPVLGFWMLPLGFIILSHDIPLARRWRRRMGLAWARRRREKAEGKR